MGPVDGVERRIVALWPHLNEWQRRLLLGVEARELGRGGVTAVALAAGVSRLTVQKAVAELGVVVVLPVGRSRRAGGGRKTVVAGDPGLVAALGSVLPIARAGRDRSSSDRKSVV